MYEHLKEIRVQNNWIKPNSGNGNHKKSFKKVFNPDLETITSEVTSYLLKHDIKEHSVELITNLMADLSKFELEKIEKLQIINSTPHSLVNLYSIVEECDQRFTEGQSQEILDVINRCFPSKDFEGEVEEGEGEEEEGEGDEMKIE